MGLFEKKFDDNIIVEKLDKLLSWSRSTSPWFFQFGTACCAIEMMAAAASRHDLKRIGMIPRSSPRQADVMIVAGTVTMKMGIRVKNYMSKWPIQSMLSQWAHAQRVAAHIGSMAIMF